MPRLPLIAALCCLAAPALAEVELGFYGGWQGAPGSDVSIEGDAVLPDQDFTAGWEGRSFEAPPQYGLRATWWPERFGGRLGVGIDANHTTVHADDETLDESSLDRLEFSDGLNILTLNGMRRWPDAFGAVTPYVGAGVGVAIPRVEVEGAGSRTSEYQLTGPAVTLMAGASVPIAENWSVFGEYKGTYSINDADLDGGGTLEADVLTNAINLGVSFSF
jgi:lipid A oxidase